MRINPLDPLCQRACIREREARESEAGDLMKDTERHQRDRDIECSSEARASEAEAAET